MDITVGGPRLDLGGVLPNHSFNLATLLYPLEFLTNGEVRCFRTEWCDKYPWLHYDVTADRSTVFCHLCMRE